MRIMLAPDSFKESLSAQEAAEAMAEGVQRVNPAIEIDSCPVSDGGEGFVLAMVAARSGELYETETEGPLGSPVRAVWGKLPNNTAVIEMSAAAGLHLLPEAKRNPLHTSTYGVGQLILAGLINGCRKFLIGIGGSATHDGGLGMMQALGWDLFDKRGQAIIKRMCGGLLVEVGALRFDPALYSTFAGCRFTIACDVTNPLTGPDGAAAVYGPQKGANPRQVQTLDAGLRHIAELWRVQLRKDVEQLPGAGAAGGMGGGMVAMLDARLKPGIAMVLKQTGFSKRVKFCDLCFTGEGRLDAQTLSGKAVLGVAQGAKQAGVPAIALAGTIAGDTAPLLGHGLHAVHSISTDHPADYAMKHAAELLADKTEAAVLDWIAQRAR